jgi:hypothetical protein
MANSTIKVRIVGASLLNGQDQQLPLALKPTIEAGHLVALNCRF